MMAELTIGSHAWGFVSGYYDCDLEIVEQQTCEL